LKINKKKDWGMVFKFFASIIALNLIVSCLYDNDDILADAKNPIQQQSIIGKWQLEIGADTLFFVMEYDFADSAQLVISRKIKRLDNDVWIDSLLTVDTIGYTLSDSVPIYNCFKR
jgi:hypothetical protein